MKENEKINEMKESRRIKDPMGSWGTDGWNKDHQESRRFFVTILQTSP